MSGGFVKGGGRTSIGPATAEGNVDAEAEFAGFGLGVADVFEHVRANEGLVDQVFSRIIDDLGIDEG